MGHGTFRYLRARSRTGQRKESSSAQRSQTSRILDVEKPKTLAELRAGISSGRTRAIDLAASYYERIERKNPRLNAYLNSGAVAGTGAGVLGLAFGAKNTAVQGHNSLGTAVSGTTDSTAADATAVLGVVSSSSPGGFSSAVRGQNNGTSGLGIGVWGFMPARVGGCTPPV